jgi:hypothetical protein
MYVYPPSFGHALKVRSFGACPQLRSRVAVARREEEATTGCHGGIGSIAVVRLERRLGQGWSWISRRVLALKGSIQTLSVMGLYPL